MTGAVAERRMLIGGDLVTAAGGETFPSVDPATGQEWARIPAASPADVDRAVAAARAAFEGDWSTLTATARGELLFAVADRIAACADELAEIETRDCGKLHKEARSQMGALPRWYRFFGGLADKVDGRVPPYDFPTVLNVITREPVGVVAALSAWNSPLMLATWKLAPALATGNTVVLKPSEVASASALRFGGLFAEAGFPPGVVNVITGAAQTGAALVVHPDVDLVSFTGGPRTAMAIAQSTAKRLTPTVFELGGKSANVLMDDCDLEAATAGVVAGVFAAAGQTCVAGGRAVVHRDVMQRFLKTLLAMTAGIRVGPPSDPETQVGPIVSEEQCGRIEAMVAAAVDAGATVAAGGRRVDAGGGGGAYYAPTVLTGVRADMAIAREEVFGPVLCVLEADSEEEAIRLANGTEYGLAAGLWTRDVKRAHRMARALRAGTVWVNTYRTMSPLAPHGGDGLSGYGRENGIEAIQEFTQSKSVLIELSEEARDPFVGRVS